MSANPPAPAPLRLAVVGGGWAGLAAAVQAVRSGHAVTLYEMAPQLGGRARSVAVGGHMLDNGQHIMIGAYRATLALMREVGADLDALLLREPLALPYPDGSGLRMGSGAPVPAFARAVLAYRRWGLRERLALLSACTHWLLRGFRCAPDLSVATLCRSLPPRVRAELIDPLCVAALNTPSPKASAEVFLRVLRDALFGPRGGADLLLPRRPLSELLAAPAERWLRERGVALRAARRVQQLQRDGDAWRVDDERFGAVVLAASAAEAARLAAPIAPAWAAQAHALCHEPIVTVYVRSAGTHLPQAMTALHDGADLPAQFVFDHGWLRGEDGLFALVVSGAAAWVERGLQACAQAALQQLVAAFPAGTWATPPQLVHVAAEKRATFLCTPGLQRPPARVAPGLVAAGDYVAGPYPATLEGAVRSGEVAIALLP